MGFVVCIDATPSDDPIYNGVASIQKHKPPGKIRYLLAGAGVHQSTLFIGEIRGSNFKNSWQLTADLSQRCWHRIGRFTQRLESDRARLEKVLARSKETRTSLTTFLVQEAAWITSDFVQEKAGPSRATCFRSFSSGFCRLYRRDPSDDPPF